MINKDKLKVEYEIACNNYLYAFCKKHGYYFYHDAWLSNDAGTIACIADYYIDIVTIRYDVDNDVQKDEFLKWYDYCIELGSLGDKETPCFKAWCMGCPRKSPEDIEKIRATHKRIEFLKADLEKSLEASENETDF